MPQTEQRPRENTGLSPGGTTPREAALRETLVRRRPLAAVVVALAATLLSGYAAWWSAIAAEAQEERVVRTQSVLIQLEATLGHLVDAETGARGFALTGTGLFLDPYELAMRARGQDVLVLRQLAADVPGEAARLEALTEKLRAAYEFTDEMVTARRRSEGNLAVSALEENKRRVDAVRASIQSLQTETERQLRERERASRSAHDVSSGVAASAVALGLISLTLAGWTIQRVIRRNATLHEHLKQRTAALQGENAKGVQIQERLRASEEMFRLLLDGIKDYAVYMLNPRGEVASWNTGAMRIKGYESNEILGRHFGCFYEEADRLRDLPEKALEEAVQTGRHEQAGWRVRKDHSKFWGNSVITPMYDEDGALRGYSKVVCDITARKRAEDRLQESREQLAAVIQSAMDGMITVDERHRVILFNAAAEHIFGYPAAQAIGRPLDAFIPQRFQAQHRESIGEFEKTGVTSRSMKPGGTLWGVRSSGEEFPVEASISQVAVDGKKFFTAIVRDITERERTQAVLREQEQVLELAQIMVRDLDGSIVRWNRGIQELYGFTKAEALGRVSHELLKTEFTEPLAEIQVRLNREGRWEGELIHRRRDGGRIVVSSVWVLYRDAQGRPARILEANFDITARKTAEDELKRIETALRMQTGMLHSVLDSMGEGLVAADENGKFLLWNPAAESILGKGATDLPPHEWSAHYGVYRTDGVTLFPTEELPLLCALRGKTSRSEMVIRRPGGDVWLEAVARPLRDERGLSSGGVIALRDITEKKIDEGKIRKLNDELENRVIERTAQLAAANQELEAFTYSVSHDLRAPLRHIAGFTGMLIENAGPQLDEGSRKLLRRVQEGTRLMGQMIDELLGLARVGRQTPSRQATGLNSIVEEVLRMLKGDSEGRAIEWRIGRLPFVDCDPMLVRLVFQNLISNALKYSRPRSPAVIEIGETEDKAFFVRDNGVGFSMKYANKLFGVFQRLHRAEDFEGTGVGLATVQRIVHKHGGRIWAEAELDRGAAFYFTLAPAENTQVATKNSDKNADQNAAQDRELEVV